MQYTSRWATTAGSRAAIEHPAESSGSRRFDKLTPTCRRGSPPPAPRKDPFQAVSRHETAARTRQPREKTGLSGMSKQNALYIF